MHSARSLSPGLAQGNLELESIDARYTRSSSINGGPVSNFDSGYQELAAVNGEFRGGSEVPGLEIGAGGGSLSSVYLDVKYQFWGKPWREGFASALDGQIDYFPLSYYNDANSSFSSGFGGSAGLTVAQFVGCGDLNLGARFGSLPQGTLYAYYSLFDLAGQEAPADNYFELNASLDFSMARSFGLSLGLAYRSYIQQSFNYSSSSESENVALPGFCLAALTLSFGGQIPLTQEDVEGLQEPSHGHHRHRRRDDAEDDTGLADKIQAGKALVNSRNYQAAITVFQDAEDDYGDSQCLSMWIGFCYYQTEDYEHALEAYQSVLSYAPDDAKLQAFVFCLEKKVASAPVPSGEALLLAP